MAQSEILLEAGTNELEIIEFYIDEEGEGEGNRNYFGVNVAKVLEVIESPNFDRTIKSAVDPCFMGTIPLREKILPVLDLSVWLGLARKSVSHEVILVTEFNNRITGFLASGVTQIHRLSWSDIEAPSHYLSEMDSNCINGIARIEGRFVQMLDLEKILAEFDPAFTTTDDITVRAPKQYNALIVDDSTIMRHLIKEKLTKANFLIKVSDNGQEAWDKLKALQEEAESNGQTISDLIDIVVSDIEMPVMDGYSLTKRIKTDPELGKLPVILFSSLITQEQRHRGVSVGADDQITKPEFDELAGRLVALIER
jgi:two-component system, chemotaxis family, chemotaxis protein CheV